jgi:adenylate kinase
MENISGRRVHEASNRTYHIKWDPPKKEGIDDVTGEPLVIRKEDDPVRVAKRMKVYHQEEEPYFWPDKNMKGVAHKIDASKSIEEVRLSIANYFDQFV